MKKIMRLTNRDGTQEPDKEIGGFREDGRGYKVQDTKGKELGYFGPDKYKDLVFIFETHWAELESNHSA